MSGERAGALRELVFSAWSLTFVELVDLVYPKVYNIKYKCGALDMNSGLYFDWSMFLISTLMN